MSSALWVNQARRAAGLSQRELSRRSGVAQSAIARIERSQQIPRTDTLEKLLASCEFELRLGPVRGGGVDRREIVRFLELSPTERLGRGVAAANLARAYGIADEGLTIAAVLRIALEDSVRDPVDAGES